MTLQIRAETAPITIDQDGAARIGAARVLQVGEKFKKARLRNVS